MSEQPLYSSEFNEHFKWVNNSDGSRSLVSKHNHMTSVKPSNEAFAINNQLIPTKEDIQALLEFMSIDNENVRTMVEGSIKTPENIQELLNKTSVAFLFPELLVKNDNIIIFLQKCLENKEKTTQYLKENGIEIKEENGKFILVVNGQKMGDFEKYSSSDEFSKKIIEFSQTNSSSQESGVSSPQESGVSSPQESGVSSPQESGVSSPQESGVSSPQESSVSSPQESGVPRRPTGRKLKEFRFGKVGGANLHFSVFNKNDTVKKNMSISVSATPTMFPGFFLAIGGLITGITATITSIYAPPLISFFACLISKKILDSTDYKYGYEYDSQDKPNSEKIAIWWSKFSSWFNNISVVQKVGFSLSYLLCFPGELIVNIIAAPLDMCGEALLKAREFVVEGKKKIFGNNMDTVAPNSITQHKKQTNDKVSSSKINKVAPEHKAYTTNKESKLWFSSLKHKVTPENEFTDIETAANETAANIEPEPDKGGKRRSRKRNQKKSKKNHKKRKSRRHR